MPIYQYRCENDHTFEVHQSMADDPLTECEVCGAPVEKVLRSPAIRFTGSGFYNTDYGTRKANQGRAGETDGGDGKGGGATGGDSTGTSDSSGSSGSTGSGDSKKSGETSKPAASTGSSGSD